MDKDKNIAFIARSLNLTDPFVTLIKKSYFAPINVMILILTSYLYFFTSPPRMDNDSKTIFSFK